MTQAEDQIMNLEKELSRRRFLEMGLEPDSLIVTWDIVLTRG